MPFNKKDSEEEKLRELEIEDILEETRYLTDQEKMEETAQKYRAKPKMDDIFSNASKKPRLKNENPLNLDETSNTDDTPTDKNTILGEAKAAAKKTEEEKKKSEEENKIVTLTPEYDEDTRFSNEVLNEVEPFKENESHIQSINSIDIDLNEDEFKKEEENEKAAEESQYEKLFGIKNSPDGNPPKKVVAKVPVYKMDEPSNTLNVKAGKFSEVLEHEYEEYINSKNPSVIAHVIKSEPKEVLEDNNEPKSTRSVQEKIISSIVGFFSKDESDDNDTPHEKSKPVDDYTNESDEKSIMYELNLNIKKLFMRSVLTGAIALVMIILTIVTRIFPAAICSAIPFAPAAYAALNFVLVGFSLFVNRVAMLSGLTLLAHFKGNSDTAVAAGGVAAIIQAFVSFFCLGDATTL